MLWPWPTYNSHLIRYNWQEDNYYNITALFPLSLTLPLPLSFSFPLFFFLSFPLSYLLLLIYLSTYTLVFTVLIKWWSADIAVLALIGNFNFTPSRWSRLLSQLVSTYWSFHIGWENVTGRWCTLWVWECWVVWPPASTCATCVCGCRHT